ncbi:MAG: thiamine pyrophosphate-dependent enzyme, partial [Chloroflexota bacterium]|nr:thiamine pyrophosphate-dependent enzyme [Chloroflexota bacterium]
KLNAIGLSKEDYSGAPSTLCKGCGHNAIVTQMIEACYEENIPPEKVVKFSGIGCSSKAPTYFMKRSFGFNGLHGRMPSLATGALFADTSLIGIGVSGDGDSASIGMGQFKHIMRRNVPLVYIIANNGVYGLTKGQMSATAEEGLFLKKQGQNMYMPVDIVLEALVGRASFVARGFSGDTKQLKDLFKAALHHRGTAVIDVISPCVTFNNKDDTLHSYAWGKLHEVALHEYSFVPAAEEITTDYEKGQIVKVDLHDGTHVILKKLGYDYVPNDRGAALQLLEEANSKQELVTGLIYINPDQKTIFDIDYLPPAELNRVPAENLRPSRESLDGVNAMMV